MITILFTVVRELASEVKGLRQDVVSGFEGVQKALTGLGYALDSLTNQLIQQSFAEV
jgi:hypothetical protein